MIVFAGELAAGILAAIYKDEVSFFFLKIKLMFFFGFFVGQHFLVAIDPREIIPSCQFNFHQVDLFFFFLFCIPRPDLV